MPSDLTRRQTPLPWRAVSDDQGSFAILGASEGDGIVAFSVYAPDDRLIVTTVNALHAIAPGREIELATMLPEIIGVVRLVADDSYDCYAELHDAANAILTKLGLTLDGDGNG